VKAQVPAGEGLGAAAPFFSSFAVQRIISKTRA
jgi:hypothetical protein